MMTQASLQISRHFAQWILLIASLLLTNAAFAEKYYIALDGNDDHTGTLARPWKTLAKANASLLAGDTVFIRQGTYHERIEPAHSGTAVSKIRYVNYPDEVVKIVGSSAAEYVVEIYHAYIVIEGLTLYHEDLPACSGYDDCWDSQNVVVHIGYGDSHHVEILNNKIISPYPLVTLDTQLTSRETGISIRGPDTHHNLIQGNEIRNMSKIGIGFSRAPKFTRVLNNTIVGVYQDAIHYGSGLGVISGTLIEGNVLAGSVKSDGVQCNAPTTENRGIIIRNNIMYDNAENNIDLKGTKYIIVEGNTLYAGAGDNDGGTEQNNYTPPGVFNDRFGGVGGIGHGGSTPSEDIIIRNNIIYDNHSGIGTKGASLRWKIYNNTLANNTHDYAGSNSAFSSARKPAFVGVIAQNGNRQTLRNNIIGDSPQGEIRAPGPGIHADYNLYFNTFKAAEFAHFRDNNDWDIVSFSQWKNIIDDDHHSIVANPLFMNVPSKPFGAPSQYDFSLQESSPAIDAGAFLTTASSGGSGTQITVTDARFFYDGFGVIPGDLIQFEGQTQTARITAVDYENNRLTVDGALTWNAGDGVGLPYNGSAPDIGAIEFGDVTSPDYDGDGVPDSIDPDDDNDGMPDVWEIEHGLNPLDNSDRNQDADDDGWSNFEEYQFGSNPIVFNHDTNHNGVPDVIDEKRRQAGIIPAVDLLLLN